MRSLLGLLALIQIISFVQCGPHVLHASHNNGERTKLARRLEFESHLNLPSRLMRRKAKATPITTPEGDSERTENRSATATRTINLAMRGSRSVPESAHSRKFHFADRKRKHPRGAPNMAPTPAPTGSPSNLTTVFITDENNFALLLPTRPGELISDAESDAQAYCSSTSGPVCSNVMSAGFIKAAAVSRSPDNDWIQMTGCIDPSKMSVAPDDDGGQFDVRFPNGAQCVFGGYGASFIEQVEPSSSRFCLRCCATANDQTNCNSHQDRAGCPVAIPGQYDFPELGVSCS